MEHIEENHRKISELDSYTCDLSGQSLVEAGAGTGKTYNIQILFLRLILQGVDIRKILVVTFTEAATAELVDRLHTILKKMQELLNAPGLKDNPDYAQVSRLLPQGEEQLGAARSHVAQAMQDFDRASISTIHGFCNKMLNENAFESNVQYNLQLKKDTGVIQQKIKMDYYRRNNYIEAEEGDTASPISVMDIYRLWVLDDKPQDPDTIFDLAKEAIKNPGTKLDDDFAQGMDAQDILSGLSAEWHSLLEKITCEEYIGVLKAFQTAKEEFKGNNKVVNRMCCFDGIINFPADGKLSLEQKKKLMDALKEIAEVYTAEKVQKAYKKGASTNLHEGNDYFYGVNEEIDRFLKSTEGWDSIFIRDFLAFYNSELEKYKQQENFLTYDDMIQKLAERLDGDESAALRSAIQQRYQYAFVDEFQDTDPTQYKIFTSIFSNLGKEGGGAQHGFFMIGDPKQAIYSFRGGDVFAYLGASQNADNFYTLKHNYRSSKNYIAALNEFYGSQKLPFGPFGMDCIQAPDIQYPEGHGETLELCLGDRPLSSDSLLELVSCVKKEQQGDSVEELTPKLYCLNKIREFTATGKKSIQNDSLQDDIEEDYYFSDGQGKKRRVSFGDIAILTKSNRDITDYKKLLTDHGIPAVIETESNILDTDEARNLLLFLTVLKEEAPTKETIELLVSSIFQFNAETLLARQNDLGDIQAYFQKLRGIWENTSFIAMFRKFMYLPDTGEGNGDLKRTWMERDGNGQLTSRNMVERIAEHSGAEALSIYLQLGEVLHNIAMERNWSMTSLHSWLCRAVPPKKSSNEQDDNDSQEDEDTSNRLAELDDRLLIRRHSNKNAVTIMTIHKSKGLEFPIVFIPEFLDSGRGNNKNPLRIFHLSKEKPLPGAEDAALDVAADVEEEEDVPESEGAASDSIEAYYGVSKDKDKDIHFERFLNYSSNKEKGNLCYEEWLLERLRLLYVGITRAKFFCSLPFKVNGGTGLKGIYSAFYHCLLPTTNLSSYRCDVTAVPETASQQEQGAALAAPLDFSDTKTPRGYIPCSYSAIDGSKKDADIYAKILSGTDEPSRQGEDDDSKVDQKTLEALAAEHQRFLPGDEEQAILFKLSSGTNGGTVWHEYFEKMPFQLDEAPESPFDNPQLGSLFRSLAHSYLGKEEVMVAVKKAFTRMLRGILYNPIANGFSLSMVTPDRRLSELDFSFTIPAGFNETILVQILDANGIAVPMAYRERCKELEQDGMQRKYVNATMNGSIDLLCQNPNDGRFFIIDWKSNRRSAKMTDFDRTGMQIEVDREFYNLQYLVYSIAFIHFYEARTGLLMDEALFDKVFGGVCYIFARGVAAPLDTMSEEEKAVCLRRGFFFTRPSFALLKQLQAMFEITM